MPKPLPFDRIDALLSSSLKKLKLEKTFQVYPIWKEWQTLAGPVMAAKTQPDYVMKQVLYVSVENSAWLQEVEFQKRDLLKKIQAAGFGDRVSEIRFRLKKD